MAPVGPWCHIVVNALYCGEAPACRTPQFGVVLAQAGHRKRVMSNWWFHLAAYDDIGLRIVFKRVSYE
jgi:hypothetical protein